MNQTTAFASSALVAASQRTRSPAQVVAERIAAPLWLIILTGKDGESYIPETPLHVMRNERSTLNHISQARIGDDIVTVLNVLEDGRIEDVSEDVARDFAREMYRDGWDVDHIETTWVRQRLTNDEIDEVCR